MDNERLAEIAAAVAAELKRGTAYKSVPLKAARLLIAEVEKKAAEMGVNAVAAVSDSGAHPVAVECMDGAFIASFDVALNKAYTVVALKMSTHELKRLAQPGGSLYGIQHTNGGRIVVFGGGDPLIYGGEVIGGLGVSGGTEEQDTALSAYGASRVADIMDKLRK